jgi:ferredoxin
VKVIVRSEFNKMKASPWEKEDAMAEGIPIINNHVPREFLHEGGRLTGMRFDVVEVRYDEKGRRSLEPTGEVAEFACDDVLIAIGQENAFPWIERDLGLEFGKWDVPVIDPVSFQSTLPRVFFGGDAAFGPKNVITAVAHGHQAAISIDLFCQGQSVRERPAPGVTLISQKMGVHEWSYDNGVVDDLRHKVPHADPVVALRDRKIEVELGFDTRTALAEAQRCLNCDVQTVFSASRCIECDACVDICPVDCINFIAPEEESALRPKLRAPARNLEQDLYVSPALAQTARAMVKDENVCLHCGLCAERCPTGAWDMQKFLYHVTKAGQACAPSKR